MAFPHVPNFVGTNLQNWAWSVTAVIRNIMGGKTDNTGSLTLTANSATTTYTLAEGRLSNDTVVLLSPTTANAATEFAAGTLYVSSVDAANNQITITHVNNAQTDRTFDFVLVG